MPENNGANIQVHLDIPKSIANIKEDLKKISGQLANDKSAQIKAVGGLDITKTKELINAQLATINGKNAPKIDLQVNTNGASQFKQTLETVQQTVGNTTNTVKTLSSSLMDLPAKFTTAIKPVTDTQGFVKVEETINKVKDAYKELGTISVNRLYNDDASSDSMKAFTVQIQSAIGETRNLQFELNKTGSAFEYIGGSANDKGVNKFTDDLAKASAKANVEATKLTTTFDKLKAKIEDTGAARPIADNSHISDIKAQYTNVETAIEAVRNADSANLAQMEANADAEISKLKSLESGYRNAEAAATALRTRDIGTVVSVKTEELNKIVADLDRAGISGKNLNSDIQDLKTTLSSVDDKDGLTNYLNKLDVFKAKVGVAKAEVEKFKAAAKFKTDKTVFSNQISAYMAENTKAAKKYRSEFAQIQNQLKNVDASGLQQLKREFTELKTRIKSVGDNTKTIVDQLKDAAKKFTTWMSLTTVISAGARTIKDMVSTVVELDTAMVDLKKTTDATDAQLQDFYYSANGTAKQLGVTTAEVINATSAWSRLGYAIDDAKTLAENSAIFASISPEMDIDTASDGLVSIMKAFKINADESLDGIISKINEVGNTYAVNNEMIVDAMTRSSAAMVEGNNTLEQTIAMNTAAIEITQNAEITSTALRTLSMRIRGFDEETEQMSDDLVNISGDIADLTKTAKNAQGISIFTDETKSTYKSTYDLIKEIATIYDDLTDKQQANLLEKLAGKRSAQTVAALISNFSQAEAAINTMNNSAGGAMQEMEIIEESLAYKLNQLQETLTGISQNNFSKEFLGGIIDFGTGALTTLDKITSKLGTIPTLIATIGIGKSFLGTGGDKFDVPRFFKRICPSYACGNTERVYAKMVA